jgi:putative inorganic carbon (hco3(-)) transporter
MDNQNLELSPPEIAQDSQETVNESDEASYSHKASALTIGGASDMLQTDKASNAPNDPPPPRNSLLTKFSPFWRDRFIEAGLILSIGLYYITGNANLGTGGFFHLNPLFSLPFLFIFAMLCWYRLPFAVALLPLALPYYLLQKTVVGAYAFSLTETALGVCLIVALLQLLVRGSTWQYWLSWRELWDRLGPFTIPILVFLVAAAISITVASEPHLALRAFRKEVFDPLVYFLLVLFCLRSRGDLMRLSGALLAAGLLVTFLSLAQYFIFRDQLVQETGNVLRVHAAYGSANDVGLLLDYVLPIGLAFAIAKIPGSIAMLKSWQVRALAIALCLPLILVLYLSQSHGAWMAIAAAVLFIAVFSIRNRKILIVGAILLLVVSGLVFAVFHTQIISFLLDSHVNAQGISTTTKRLYLWRTALNMIHNSPWFGYGMDNWLCHYSRNTICYIPGLKHYWILTDPVTHAPTGLIDEPDLSHPHNIFLHVWVSIGVFGLLAFIVLLVLFFWLFIRILAHLRSTETGMAPARGATTMSGANLLLQSITIGIGAAMFAALVQGQVDSSFLEQDLAFCFWILVAALLLVRVLSETSWRRHVERGHAKEMLEHDGKTIEKA